MTNINELQLLQQNLQTILAQKQQLQNQLIEFESALHELQSTSKAYRIVGKIMLVTPKETLNSELREKKEVLEVRLKNIERQEDKLKQNMERVQQDVIKELKEKK